MARYIDADELTEEIKSLKISLGGKDIFSDRARESVLRIIDEQATADVVEVKHGILSRMWCKNGRRCEMTCKDCIHCRACHEMYLLAVAQEDDFFERHDAETCEDFKNEADFVEVVRCKDCDYMTYFKGRVMCSRYAKKINDETWYGLVATDNEHYCSYGERRDT